MKWIALYFLFGILLTTIGVKLMIDQDTIDEVLKEYPKSQIIASLVIIAVIWPYFLCKLLRRANEKIKEEMEKDKNDRS